MTYQTQLDLHTLNNNPVCTLNQLLSCKCPFAPYRYESELSIRQSVEADIVGLRKLIDDTNLSRMNLESEIEALKEELIHLKKNHDNVSWLKIRPSSHHSSLKKTTTVHL